MLADMYVLTHASVNLWRHRGRNALLGAAVFLVVATSVVALMITSTSDRIISEYRAQFGSEVRFQPVFDRLRAEAMANAGEGPMRLTMPQIDAEQLLDFADSDLLAGVNFTASTGVVPESLTMVDEELGGGSQFMAVGMPGALPGPDGEELTPMAFTASLVGGSFTEFEDGSRALAQGRLPQDLGEVIVSSELAELNGLQLGDTFSASGELMDVGASVEERALVPVQFTDLTVVGIYDDATDPFGTARAQNAFTNTRNQILTTFETVQAQHVAGTSGMQIAGTFFLADPGDIDAFEAEVRAKGLPDVFDVATDTATFERVVGPVESLRDVAHTFLIVVLVLGAAIIALLASIAVRERRYEIGVLRSMGMRKRVVATGLWLENLLLTGVFLALGLVSGVLAAQPVTSVLLDAQVQSMTADPARTGGPTGAMGGMGGMGMFGGAASHAEPLSDLAIHLTPAVTGQITLIALAIATVAGLVAVGKITQYEPMTILNERS